MKFTFGRQQNDSELISAIIRGDVGAYEQLFVRYYPTLLHFIRGMLKDDHMSEDIAQNIFMKLWIHREKLDSTQSVKNYLFVLAKHEIYNIFKAKRTTMLSLLPQLSEEEADVYRRGRNTAPHSVPKAASRAQYQAATGLEALFGWLYLQGRTQRLNELFEIVMKEEEEEKECR